MGSTINFNHKRFGHKVIASGLLASLMLSLTVPPLAWAQPDALSGDVKITVVPHEISRIVDIAGADRIVNLSLHGVSIQDALRALAKKGGFNVVVHSNVQGIVSVDLHDVSIQDALDTLRTYGNLAYRVDGNHTLIAVDADSDEARNFARAGSKVIPLRYANAKMAADILNSTVFGVSSRGGGATQQALPVSYDYHSNSVIVAGTPSDVASVQSHIEALDIPRDMKTWRLSHADALDVATIIASSVFNDGTATLQLQNAGGAAGGAGQQMQQNAVPRIPSSLRVRTEEIEEGEGAGETAGGDSQAESVVVESTIRSKVKTDQIVQISPEGPIVLPDTRLNTITILGTAQQIALVDSLMPTFDRKAPQVLIEVSLIELGEVARKELGFSSSGNSGEFSFGSNNTQLNTANLVNNAFSNAIGLATSATTPLESLFQFSTRSANHVGDLVYQINALVSQSKAKLLANPTILTTSDSEGIVSIVDEIITQVVTTANGAGAGVASEAEIGEVGVFVNVLPKVGPDGNVNMRIRPSVSTISSVTTDRFGNIVTLLSKREVISQSIMLRDGESFVLGGLIQSTDTDTLSKIPFLADLPIVGALARNSTRAKDRSELVIVLTPHILNDEASVARDNAQSPMEPSNYLHPPAPNGTYGYSTPDALPPLQAPNVLSNYDGTDQMAPRQYPNKQAPVMLPSTMLMNSPQLDSSVDKAPLPKKEEHFKEKVEFETDFSIQPYLPKPSDTPSAYDSGLRSVMDKFKE